MSTAASVTIPGDLVPYLRRGVRRELAASLVHVAIEVETTADRTAYDAALARFDASRSLLDTIGISDQPEQQAIELDLDTWPTLIVKSLEAVQAAELTSTAHTKAASHDSASPELRALAELIKEIRSKTDASPTLTRRWLFPIRRRPRRTPRH